MGHIGGEGDSLSHLNLTELIARGSWAFAHEIGHNVQWMTGFYHHDYVETTNNLWSLFVNRNVIISLYQFILPLPDVHSM